MSSTMSSKFFAKIWLSPNDVEEIDVWVHELDPVDPAYRPARDWVLDYLKSFWSITDFLDLIGNPAGSGVYQILATGTITGWRDYFGEYDETLEFDQVEWLDIKAKTGPIKIDIARCEACGGTGSQYAETGLSTCQVCNGEQAIIKTTGPEKQHGEHRQHDKSDTAAPQATQADVRS